MDNSPSTCVSIHVEGFVKQQKNLLHLRLFSSSERLAFPLSSQNEACASSACLLLILLSRSRDVPMTPSSAAAASAMSHSLLLSLWKRSVRRCLPTGGGRSEFFCSSALAGCIFPQLRQYRSDFWAGVLRFSCSVHFRMTHPVYLA